MKTRILLCGLFALTLGCVDKVDIKNENFTQQPVIVGKLNSNGSLQVRVSLTTKLDQKSKNTPVENANIRLWTKNSTGEDEIVTDNFDFDKLNNTYAPKDVIKTKEGGIYWLELLLSDGKSYVSKQEEMPTSVEVSNIVYTNNQLRAIFKDEKDKPNYYLAEFNIYETEGSNFITDLKVVSNDILFDGNEKAYIGEYTTLNLRKVKYYVELNLESLSNSSYIFYRNLIEQEGLNEGFGEEEGSPQWLFSTPPLNLYGNITEKESGKKVLGQFIVSGITKKTQNID